MEESQENGRGPRREVLHANSPRGGRPRPSLAYAPYHATEPDSLANGTSTRADSLRIALICHIMSLSDDAILELFPFLSQPAPEPHPTAPPSLIPAPDASEPHLTLFHPALLTSPRTVGDTAG